MTKRIRVPVDMPNDKTDWVDLGTVIEQKGRQVLVLKPYINLAALVEPGNQRVFAQVHEFEDDERK